MLPGADDVDGDLLQVLAELLGDAAVDQLLELTAVRRGDHDPIDVLVCNTRPLIPGCQINVRPIGVLIMEDNSGQDEKIIAVPSPHLTKRYENVRDFSDLPDITLKQISHFFEHYKDLEPGKWVRIGDWMGAADAKRLIVEAIDRAKGKG